MRPQFDIPSWCRSIRSTKTFGSRKDKKVLFFNKLVIDWWSDCWLWFGAIEKHSGYGIASAGGNRTDRAHRVSWRMFRGEIPPGLYVLHKCDVRNCVNPSHLFLGTQLDNVRDMCQKGRRRNGVTVGEKNNKSKLTTAQVLEIRRLRTELKTPFRKLAPQFGVDFTTIRRICVGLLWKHTT